MLMRHEIVSLHLANTKPGQAEFYPNCAQLNVVGPGTPGMGEANSVNVSRHAGTFVPAEEDLVTFPGGYDDNSPGLFNTRIFDLEPGQYIYPGPPIPSALQNSENDPNPTDPNVNNTNPDWHR